MVTARVAIRQGFTLARRARSAIGILFLANLSLAALAALPIYWGILKFTAHSLMAERLTTGFSVDWFIDFAMSNQGALGRYGEIIALLGLIALPVNALLAGGILARFRNPREPFRVGQFYRDCRRYAWRMIWLMVIALLCYWLVFQFINGKFNDLVIHSTQYWMDDRAAFFARLGVGALVLLALAFVNLVVDFTQVRLVLRDGAGVLESFLASLGFCLGWLPKAAMVYAVPALCGVALLGIYRLLVPWHLLHMGLVDSPHNPYRAPVALAVLFIVQQLVIFGRYWFRVATWGSEWALYASRFVPAAPEQAQSGSQPS